MDKKIKVLVIPSRFNLFWWEAVISTEGIALKSLGQFRTEEEAYDFIKDIEIELV